jgi:hypothetical protein
MAFTFGQMADLFYQRIDQSGSPDFTKRETDRLLNWGYDVWYIINRKKFDTDQANSVNMTHLIRPFTFSATSEITVVGTGANIPDYRDVSQMKARFSFTDCNGVATEKDVNVTPVPLSVVDVNRNDPYNKPTDEYPMYSQTHNGTFRIVRVDSTTVPIRLTGAYFKALQTIDCENNPNTEFEAQDYVARQVVDIAKILAKGDLDDYAAVKNAVAETSMSMA